MTVVDAVSGSPVTSAANGVVANVVYNGTTHVTRKATQRCPGAPDTSPDNWLSFGGWAGVAHPVAHTITVTAAEYQQATVSVTVAKGAVTNVVVRMTRAATRN